MDQAITVLMKAVVHPSLIQATTALGADPQARLQHCIDQVKVEASEGASLVATCAPHGKAMLTQAQQTLERLESLKLIVDRAHRPSPNEANPPANQQQAKAGGTH